MKTTALIIAWAALSVSLGLVASVSWNDLQGAELIQISQDNYDQVVPLGKEVDAIIGDWVLRNERICAVIAAAQPGRKANMTVRGVAGMLIDYTRRHHASDQLSCFYPTGGRYLFENPDGMACAVDGQAVSIRITNDVARSTVDAQPALAAANKFVGKSIAITFEGTPVAQDGTTAKLTYLLSDDQDWLDYDVTLTNASQSAIELPIEESLRCDGSQFQDSLDESLQLFSATDLHFGQSYGWMLNDAPLASQGSGRNLKLRSLAAATGLVAPGESVHWQGAVACSQGLPSIRSWARGRLEKLSTVPVELTLNSSQGPVVRAVVEIFRSEQSLGVVLSDERGTVRSQLLPGEYRVLVKSTGRPARELAFAIDHGQPHADTLSLPDASRVRAEITDDRQQPIAAKVQFIGLDGTPDPNFGPDAAAEGVRNAVYCAAGRFEQALEPGRYQTIVSHGPEYDAVMREIDVSEGQVFALEVSLQRSVDTSGWISADFHGHSSPSGDNVASQRGRVLNLLAEHIEFAPCTEHNRIDTYSDELKDLQATSALATCTGMELTGSPLPLNHQNAFPLLRHVHHQDGGGPDTHSDPVQQIERLALWDNSSNKLVQSNHPNIPQMLGDADLDGVADEGFRGMLGWMDVIEVHPPEGIFTPPSPNLEPQDKDQNPIFYWLQLLNMGYRIPGVVNTDAHANFHGSGWLRNYLSSATDDPAQISVEEVIHAADHGHSLMTTGPFLQVELRVPEQPSQAAQTYISGDDVKFPAGQLPAGEVVQASLWVRVQCANWLDVNRVQVFANGRPVEKLNFTRKSHPRLFSSETIRFEHEMELGPLQRDTHIIVATIGEGLSLGPVMGPERGEIVPVAVINPIFIDIDGGGFQANGDDLWIPFMIPETTP